MPLRDYQLENKSGIYQGWQEGAINIMPVIPTGGGKTAVFCDIIREYDQPACTIAHRQELVSQAALALNRERVAHSIIAPDKVIKQIIAAEHYKFGYSCYNSRAPVRVAGVDTIIRRDPNDKWFSQVGLVVQDEGHHVTAANKWGQAQLMFPNARGLFPTAQAVGPGGRGLGRPAGGLVDKLVVGPHGRILMDRGFLTDYRLVCVGTDIDFASVPIGANGEYSMPKLRAETHKSKTLVGDVVKEYLKWAPGLLGITFAVDVEEAVKLRNAYHKNGVAAEIVTSETPIDVRSQLLMKFERREILQLISVDCLGEGVDVPGCQVISMARRTASWQLLCQMVGRGFRVMVAEEYQKVWNDYTDEERLRIIAMSEKPKCVIIDHVGNIIYHAKLRGLPDSAQEYTLLKVDSNYRGKPDAIPLRACLACCKPFERYRIQCPYCGWTWESQGRGTPELVEGDLVELDPSVLAALRGEVAKVNSPITINTRLPADVQRGVIRHHHERAAAQQNLQKSMMLWGGWQLSRKLTDREMQKLFYIRFGLDVMTAQTLGAAEAAGLQTRIDAELFKNNVRAA